MVYMFHEFHLNMVWIMRGWKLQLAHLSLHIGVFASCGSSEINPRVRRSAKPLFFLHPLHLEEDWNALADHMGELFNSCIQNIGIYFLHLWCPEVPL